MLGSELGLYSHLVHMYAVHAYVASLGMLIMLSRFQACRLLACGFPAGRSSFICHKDGVGFSALKLGGLACDVFRARACRARQ